MKKYILILFTSVIFAQNKFSESQSNNFVAFKACPYINLLDGGFGSILGVEKSFLKNQSIGAKFIYNFFTPHREDTEKDYKPIDYTDDKDVSFIIEYKYYMSFLKSNMYNPYLSLNYKTGKRTIGNDIDFPHDYYHRETKYNLFGLAIGTLLFSGRWKFDTQIGYLFGKKDRTTEYVVPTEFVKNEKFNTSLVRFEIMLVYTID